MADWGLSKEYEDHVFLTVEPDTVQQFLKHHVIQCHLKVTLMRKSNSGQTLKMKHYTKICSLNIAFSKNVLKTLNEHSLCSLPLYFLPLLSHPFERAYYCLVRGPLLRFFISQRNTFCKL